MGPRIYGTIKNNIGLGKKIDELNKKIEDWEGQNGKLKKFIDNFKKEDYIEKEAKTRLNLKKPGEKVVVIIEEEAPKVEGNVQEKISILDKIKAFWQKIKGSWNLRE